MDAKPILSEAPLHPVVLTEKDVVKEVKALIQGRIDEGEIAPVEWVVQTIVNAHAIEGADTEWFRGAAAIYIRSIVEDLYGLNVEGATDHGEELRRYLKEHNPEPSSIVP